MSYLARAALAATAFLTLATGNAIANTTTWLSAANGSWLSDNNWSNGAPGPSTDAIVNATGANYTITSQGANNPINSFLLNSVNAKINFGGPPSPLTGDYISTNGLNIQAGFMQVTASGSSPARLVNTPISVAST